MSDIAERVWERMMEVVLDRNDRRKQVADALGLSVVKVKALVRLAREPMTMRELAAELLIDRPYATLVVDDLESRGLVVRSVHPGDRRSKIVTVTEKGEAVADSAARSLKRPPAAILDLSDEDLARLDNILGRLMIEKDHDSDALEP